MNKILGGDIETQFTYNNVDEHHKAMEACRLEQEAMCGYALVPGRTRQTHMVDDKGVDVYEVFVTFSPAPPPSGSDATQLLPSI